ncbi:hypothetical protein QGM71_03475 [Virgibacillus sp. C22-A2]|uniref:Uncharacterized protein n=1 Tax=Virgibacillus tibetensis TaxID=3042313 RepID=A0ABU6KDH6_9BACI|nr:hypothetical protein [Virgibacillus sp. C22-A2]
MDLEWFDRVCSELGDSLDSICSKYGENGNMSIVRGAKHPRIDFFTDSEAVDREYFCTILFDPYNEEFYIQSFEPELGHESKVVLDDIEDIIDAVHESFHIYMEDDLIESEIIEVETNFHDSDEMEEELLVEDIDIQWETPEVTAYFQENEVEVSYQFGVVQETGDGVLKRTNRIWTEDEDLLKDETSFMFSKEEASTIIAMVASHMDSIGSMDYHA